MNLAESYRTTLIKIRGTGSTWVEGRNGWYVSFDKTLVKERIDEINDKIKQLEDQYGE